MKTLSVQFADGTKYVVRSDDPYMDNCIVAFESFDDSFETIVFLANKVDELGLPAVLTMEGQDHSIAETIVRNTRTKDQTIATMDSMQGTTSADVRDGVTYLSVMEGNLSVLSDALQ